MEKKISFGALVVLMLISYLCHAQYTRDQARELVLNQLYVNNLNHVNIYLAFDIKLGQSRLLLPDSDSISCPFNSNWVFFIDDDPSAGWAHPCHYIFVNAENGDNVIISKRFFPTELKTDFELISSIPHLNLVPPDPNPYDLPHAPENPHLYAVLICGAEDNVFWNDVSSVFSTLTISYGFKNQNIFVHYANGPNPPNPKGNDLDGDLYDDIKYDAHKYTIETIFNGLAFGDPAKGIPKLTPEDVLFVFTSDHGDTTLTNPGTSYICLPGNERLFPSELTNYIENINCSQMVFLMAQCFSGGFINDLMNFTGNEACKNRYVYTAASAKELSHHELWTHDGDPYFFEFVYYWVAAARHHYPHWSQPWRCAYPLGNFPFSIYPFTKKPHSPDFNPDSDLSKGGNNDLVIQMREAFIYADSMDSWSPHGYHSLYVVWNPLEYKDENPQSSESVSNGNGGFRDNVVGLTGINGSMNTSQSVEGSRNYLFGGDLTVELNQTLTIGDNVNIFGNDMNFNGFEVYGNFQLGSYANIKDYNFTFFEPSSQVSFDHAYFDNSSLTKWTDEDLTIAYSTVEHIHSVGGNVNISHSIFNEYPLYLENYTSGADVTATVTNCIFNANNYYMAGIEVDNYKNFFIENNIIHDHVWGVFIQSCGFGVTGNQSIFNNYISNTGTGICVYNSIASIADNYIFNNTYGITVLNVSSVALFGNPSASTIAEAQVIQNNTNNEVYATATCFPWYFKNNVIIDEDNGGVGDPLVYYDPQGYLPNYSKLDVTSNCWGNNFNPDEDLYVGYGRYYVDPVWCPNGGGPIIDPPNEDELLFESATNQFDSGYYPIAKSLYQLLVQQFPYSDFANASLKELFRLEQFAGNDYAGLQQYFLTNDSILADTVLKKIGEYYANKCNEILENWPAAISWYEDIIMNPPSPEDSIFAIIDLENVYLLMENSNVKSTYAGQLLNYKPQSKRQFLAYRDSLLSLFPMNNKYVRPQIEQSPQEELKQNVPNPFMDETEICFNLGKVSQVTIIISDYMNKEIRRINNGILDKGNHCIMFKSNELPAGIYFFSLYRNGIFSETKKMIKL